MGKRHRLLFHCYVLTAVMLHRRVTTANRKHLSNMICGNMRAACDDVVARTTTRPANVIVQQAVLALSCDNHSEGVTCLKRGRRIKTCPALESESTAFQDSNLTSNAHGPSAVMCCQPSARKRVVAQLVTARTQRHQRTICSEGAASDLCAG